MMKADRFMCGALRTGVRTGVRIGLMAVVVMLGAGTAAFAAPGPVLVVQQPLVGRDAEARVTLLYMNAADQAERLAVTDSVAVELVAGLDRFPGLLRLAAPHQAGEIDLPPGGFVKLDYVLNLPAEIRPGPVQILMPESGSNGVFIMVRSPALGGHSLAEGPAESTARPTEDSSGEDHPAGDEVKGAGPKSPEQEQYVVLNEQDVWKLKKQKGVFFQNISRYEPSYILFGGDEFNAKFQLSFKYRLFGGAKSLTEGRSWLEGIHFAYTQTSFWDLAAESKPFEDNIFQPELFYLMEDRRLSFLPETADLDLQVGFRHESNGQDVDKSRSLNVLYVRPAINFDLEGERFFRLMADFRAYVGDLSDNPDIEDFRGHTGLTLIYGTLDGFQVASRIRGSFATGKGGVTFDATYPLNRLFFKNIDIFLQAQLFTGYGETLVNYNRKETRLRMGIGILR